MWLSNILQTCSASASSQQEAVWTWLEQCWDLSSAEQGTDFTCIPCGTVCMQFSEIMSRHILCYQNWVSQSFGAPRHCCWRASKGIWKPNIFEGLSTTCLWSEQYLNKFCCLFEMRCTYVGNRACSLDSLAAVEVLLQLIKPSFVWHFLFQCPITLSLLPTVCFKHQNQLWIMRLCYCGAVCLWLFLGGHWSTCCLLRHKQTVRW